MRGEVCKMKQQAASPRIPSWTGEVDEIPNSGRAKLKGHCLGSLNTLALSSQSPSGPAGGASDGYGLGRGAAAPDRRCTTTAAGALRAIV